MIGRLHNGRMKFFILLDSMLAPLGNFSARIYRRLPRLLKIHPAFASLLLFPPFLAADHAIKLAHSGGGSILIAALWVLFAVEVPYSLMLVLVPFARKADVGVIKYS